MPISDCRRRPCSASETERDTTPTEPSTTAVTTFPFGFCVFGVSWYPMWWV